MHMGNEPDEKQSAADDDSVDERFENGEVARPIGNGRGILRINEIGVAIFVVLGVLAAIFPDFFTTPYVVVSIAQFIVGMITMGLAYFSAIERSRTENVAVAGVFFASGAAPKPIQRRFLLALFVQVVVGIVVASVRVYTPAAFGVLAPLWVVGFTGLWVTAYGTFTPRDPELKRSARKAETKKQRPSASKRVK